MTSWVYVFSKFTPEALLFEALLIFVLCGGYAAFWVLKKRRLGAIQTDVPAPLVKAYLSELIVDAEQLRAQLFGLLSGGGVMKTSSAASMASLGDPVAASRLTELEAKMLEQTRAMDAIMAEKSKIEKELANMKASGGAPAASGGSGGGDPVVVTKLNEKINALEGKLAEYSVIEDDLANLKRLQQENAQLRAALSGKGAAVPAAAPAAPAAAVAAPTAPVAEAPAAAAAAATPDANFEGLVDQVENSLKTDAVPAAAAAPEAAPAAPDLGGGSEKTDADLVAEFEKMLNG